MLKGCNKAFQKLYYLQAEHAQLKKKKSGGEIIESKTQNIEGLRKDLQKGNEL